MEIIIGSAVSIVVELIKRYVGTSPIGTLISVFIISIAASIVYNLMLNADIWDSVLPILMVAGGFHNFIIRQFGNVVK